MNKTKQSIKFVFRYRLFEKLVLTMVIFPMKYTGPSLVDDQIVARYNTRLTKGGDIM